MFQNFIEEYIDNLRQDRDLRGDSANSALIPHEKCLRF